MFYIFNEKENSLVIFEDNSETKGDLTICKENITPLPLQNKNSFQWFFQHKDAILIIEKKSPSIITTTIKTPYELATITRWDNKDYGQAIYDNKKKDYVLKYGLPKIFYIFHDKYKENEPWNFQFDFFNHLVLKDKDENKPWIWYHWDYSPTLSKFVYETLYPYIPKDKGWVVALPGEQGQATEPWTEADYLTNSEYYSDDEEKEGYDFSTETGENWLKENGLAVLLITFLPTYFHNYELKKGKKLTGIQWFLKVWEVFGKHKIPVVLKCYPGFIYTLLYRNYRDLYNEVSSVCELPLSIDGREVGKANYLAFFNCDFLPERIKYELL